MAGVQGPVLGWVTTRLSERALIIGGSVLLSGGFWLYDSMTNTEIYLGATLMAAGNGVMWPSVQSMLARVAGKSYQGAIQGFAGSLGAAASILGLVLGGVLYTAIGSSVFLVSTGVTLVVTLIGSMTGGALPPNDERDAQQPVAKVTTPRAEA
jgi:MFS family permease